MNIRLSFLRSFIIYFLLLPSVMQATSLDWADPKWEWMDRQIEKDFVHFKKTGITLHMLDRTMLKVPQISFGHCLVRLKVIDGQIFGPEGNSKELLTKILENYEVPNVDVILQEQDIIWNHSILPGPVLVTCKMPEAKKLIHFPVQLWSPWANEIVPTIEKISKNSPWETKQNKAFWRGINSDADNYNDRKKWTHYRRGKVCALSNQYPEFIDAAFSGTRHWLVREDLLDEFLAFFPRKIASWEEYLQHKYLLDLDGCVAATPGYAWKLLSNCAVLKHDSRFTLYFSKALQPWVHYIPLNNDVSDIFEKITWAREHDEETKQIAENGRLFAEENLLPDHLYLYCFKVLKKYASLQKFKPRPDNY